MPRTISAPSLAKVTQQYGAEPILILEIQWVEGGQRFRYADRDIPDQAKGRILEVSNIDAVVQVSSGGDSQELSVTLSDIDDEIKGIMDAHDIHKRPCWVYQWFSGIDPAEKFLLFKGFISSPLVWDEGARTVAFDVISKIEDVEVGFSIEEGDFDNPPQDLLGKSWPLCFGTVTNVPSLEIKALQQGTLAQGIGITDPTIIHRLACARIIPCPINFEAYKIVYQNSAPFSVQPFFSRDPNCLKQVCEIVEGLELQLEEQNDFQFNSFQVYGGEKFPQNTKITLDIDGGKFIGKMNGDIFTVSGRRHPSVAANGDLDLGAPRTTIKSECGNTFGFPLGFYSKHKSVIDRWMEGAENIDNIHDLARAKDLLRGIIVFAENFTPQAPTPEEVTSSAVASRYAFEFFNLLPSLDFFWASAGAKVTLDSNKEIIYAANLLPSTIHRVAAYRTLDNGRYLATVPASYYTVREVDYNGYTVTEIVMTRLLSSRKDGWEDDVYITMTSSVGPNTVDEMEWLIETYTDFEIDTVSFAAVKTLIDNYPSHFLVPGRMNIVDLLQKMAYQSRCALWLRDDKFYLQYLSAEPTSIETIAKSDIELESMQLTHTDTEDLVTKYVVEWKSDYAADEPNKVILRHNVIKYGTHEQTDDFFIYNILELVKKSATFWLIRKANTWRKVKCRTYFNKLKLETFDCATVTHSALSDSPVKCVVEKADFDSDSRRMEFELWTPILSGSRVPYNFAFPADIEELELWPTVEERLAGKAGSGKQPNFSVIAPNGHPLANPTAPKVTMQCSGGQSIPPGAEISSFCRGDHGDSKPSDRNDQKPTPQRPKDTSGNVNTGTNPLRKGPQEIINEFAKKTRDAQDDAKKAREEANRANQNAGGDPSFDPPDQGGDPDGLPPDDDDPRRKLPTDQSGANCTVDVVTKFGIPTLVHGPPGEDPYFRNEPGDKGVIVFIDETNHMRQTFNSMTAAIASRDAQAAVIAQLSNYNYVVGTEQIWQVSLSAPDLGTDTNEFLDDGTPNPNFNQPCEEPGTEDQAQTGFTFNPFVP